MWLYLVVLTCKNLYDNARQSKLENALHKKTKKNNKTANCEYMVLNEFMKAFKWAREGDRWVIEVAKKKFFKTTIFFFLFFF